MEAAKSRDTQKTDLVLRLPLPCYLFTLKVGAQIPEACFSPWKKSLFEKIQISVAGAVENPSYKCTYVLQCCAYIGDSVLSKQMRQLFPFRSLYFLFIFYLVCFFLAPKNYW